MIRDLVLGSEIYGRSPPSFLASAKAQNSTGTATLVISKPSGVAAGHLLVAFVGTDEVAGMSTWTVPSGWTELRDQGLWPHLCVAYKVAGASEGSSYTFTSSDTGGLKSGVIVAYTGAAYDTVGAIGTASSGGNCTAPQVTVAADNSVLLAAFFVAVASSSFPAPSGMNSLDSDAGSTSPSWNVFAQAVNAGASGSRASNPSGAAGNVAGVLLSIKPGGY